MRIAVKGPLKRVRHNESLTVGCIEFDLSSIRVIEGQLNIIHTNIDKIVKVKMTQNFQTSINMWCVAQFGTICTIYKT